MALKEGRCPNCGSILFLDRSAEKGHCLYCDCVFQNDEAFKIAAEMEDDDSREFPNEEQPEYTGPSLDPKQQVKDIDFDDIARRAEPVSSKSVSANAGSGAYRIKKRDDIQIEADPQVKKVIIAVVAAAALLIAGILVPTISKRDARRSEIAEAFGKKAAKQLGLKSDLKEGEDFIIHGFSNASVTVVLKANPDEKSAVELFESYKSIRNEVSNDQHESVMKIAGEDGGWLLKDHEGVNVKQLD